MSRAGADSGYTRAYLTELEDGFVFAVWDQRGTGKSYPSLDPAETLTLEHAVHDTISPTDSTVGRNP